MSLNFKKLVSIILPFGIDRPYIKEAIASAIDQTLSHDLYEVIVVNDKVQNFTHASLMEILKDYDSTPTFLYYEVDFSSLSRVINYAIIKSSGRYYTILPDDDKFLPNKLLDLSSALEEREFSVVYSLPYKINAAGERKTGTQKVLEWAKRHPTVTWDHIVGGDGLLVNGITTMYSRYASDAAGGWDEKLLRAEEWEFHLRLLKSGYDFKLVNSYTIEYRVHGNNKSKKRGAAERKVQMSYIYNKLQIGKE
jgi:glycosyltransferase involved in cell wall biosynthesis